MSNNNKSRSSNSSSSSKVEYSPLIANADGSNKDRVIFIWSVPANGHLNPTLCFANELLLRLDDMNIKKIVFYSGPTFKDVILNLPNNENKNLIEFRDYRLEKYTGSENLLKLMMNFDTRPGTLFRVFHVFENAVKLGARHIFKNLLQDIHEDRPVLILYDQALFFPKLALNLYEKKYKQPMPIHATYVTTFMCARDVFPLWTDMDRMGLMGKSSRRHHKLKNGIVTFFDFLKYIYNYYKILWWDLGFSVFDLIYKIEGPLGRNHLIDDSLNIVFVAPEIQPRLDGFLNDFPNCKFVGPCIDENVRAKILKQKYDVNMRKYSKMIDEFLEKNLIDNIKKNSSIVGGGNINHLANGSISTTNNNNQQQQQPDILSSSVYLRSESSGENFKKLHKPIIYVSMGTVFNNENSFLFQVLVEACKFYADKYAIIVSTGDEKTYEKYATSDLNSDEILLVPHTPQVEILKRSHLFITHAGMNSVSEAITYGVPIITLPLSGDQPFVAWRLCDDLNMGIRLQPDPETLTVELVRETIGKLLTNPIYRQEANRLSEISNKYNGTKIATDMIVEFVNKSEAEIESCLSRV